MARIVLYGLLIVLLSVYVNAEMMITQVYYDPDGSDTGKEFVELHNPGEEMASLLGYELWSGDGSTADDWILEWTGTEEMVSGEGFFVIGESETDADFIAALDLQNGPDAVRLMLNGTLIDLVGWGEHTLEEYYLGSPTPLSGSGLALVRKEVDDAFVDTRVNADDFIVAAPVSRIIASGGMLSLSLVVEDVQAEILNITLEDHDPFAEGLQWIPFPGQERVVGVEVVVGHPNVSGFEVEVSFDGDDLALIGSEGVFSGNITLGFGTTPGEFEIGISVFDGSQEVGSGTTSVIVTTVAGLELDSDSVGFGNATAGEEAYITGDLDLSTDDRPTLRNIGNVPIDVLLSGTPLARDGDVIDLASLAVMINGLGGPVSGTPTPIGISLSSGDLAAIDISVSVPGGSTSGRYEGAVSLLATEVS